MGSGPRSGAYSDQRFTNWSTHDPHWLEAQGLPPRIRAKAQIPQDGENSLGVFERPLASGFVRPWTVTDVVEVLTGVPRAFVSGLSGVYLMGGTARQRRLRTLTFGMYWNTHIYLFPLPDHWLTEGLPASSKPSEIKKYTNFGAVVKSSDRGGSTVIFDEPNLRRFYLYDVLLHELGHHVDRLGTAKSPERYALWFAEYQYARLPGLRMEPRVSSN
jgi:hypothetical protein